MTLYEAERLLRKSANLNEAQAQAALQLILKELHDRPSKSSIDDLQWEIEVNLKHYLRSSIPIDERATIYAKAIIENVKIGYGIVHPIDDFMDSVKSGSYIDYDGVGEALDKDGHKLGSIRCNLNDLGNWKKHGATMVAWFNR